MSNLSVSSYVRAFSVPDHTHLEHALANYKNSTAARLAKIIVSVFSLGLGYCIMRLIEEQANIKPKIHEFYRNAPQIHATLLNALKQNKTEATVYFDDGSQITFFECDSGVMLSCPDSQETGTITAITIEDIVLQLQDNFEDSPEHYSLPHDYAKHIKAAVTHEKNVYPGVLDQAVINNQGKSNSRVHFSMPDTSAPLQSRPCNQSKVNGNEEHLTEDAITPKHKIFYGIRRYLDAKFSLFSDKYHNEIKHCDTCRSTENHVSSLLLRLTNNGDVLVITFSNGKHSSLVLRHNDKLHFLSRTHIKYHNDINQDCHQRLKREMLFYNDALTDHIKQKENVFLIKNMDTDVMLKRWGKSGSFNRVFNNCSSAARDILLAGSKLSLQDRKRLKNNRSLQMPANTGKLAEEIAILKSIKMASIEK